MTIYLLVLSLTLILGVILKPNTYKRNKRIYVISVFFVIILVSALRSYRVGIDLKNHYYKSFLIYLNIPLKKLLEISPYEDGFVIFYKVISNFTSNPQWMIAIHSIFVFGIVGWFIYRNSENTVMSTFIFITFNSWFMYMTMLRQSMAIAIILIAVEVWKKKNWKLRRYIIFLLLILLATSFHSSALIMLIYVILEHIPVKRKTILLSIMSLVIVFVFYEQFFLTISSIISISKDYTELYANDKSVWNFTAFYSIIVCVVCFIMAYITLFKNKNCKFEEEKNSIKIDHLMFLVVFLIICRTLRIKMGIVARLAEYFLPFLWILFPKAINGISKKNSKIVITYSLYVLFTIAFIWIGYVNAGSLYGTVPYEFFWDL